MITSRLDYRNLVLVSSPESTLKPVQYRRSRTAESLKLSYVSIKVKWRWRLYLVTFFSTTNAIGVWEVNMTSSNLHHCLHVAATLADDMRVLGVSNFHLQSYP